MRIYSNTLLSWPQVLHVSHASRIYPGRWQNYYFYRILNINPVQILTYSPIKLLQENMQYYCYDNLYRNKHLETNTNVQHTTIIYNQISQFGQEELIHIPHSIIVGNIIAIRDENPSGYPTNAAFILA